MPTELLKSSWNCDSLLHREIMCLNKWHIQILRCQIILYMAWCTNTRQLKCNGVGGGWGVGGWGRWIWIGHTHGYSRSAAWHHAACSASKTKLKSVGCSGSRFTNSTVMRLHGYHKWGGINLETYTMSTAYKQIFDFLQQLFVSPQQRAHQ